MAAACGAKLSVAPLPLVWILARGLQPWPRPAASRRAQVLVGLVLVLGLALVLGHRFALLGGVSPYGETTRVFAHRVGLGPVLAASTQIHLGHLQQMLVPVGLQPEYVDFGAKWIDPATVLASAALLGLLGLGLASLRRRPVLALVVLATVLLAVPTSNLAPMPNMRAERFMYCVSVPVCVGLAAACLALGRGWAARPGAPPWIVLVPLSAYVIVQGAFGQGAAWVYASEGRLWEIALRRAPHSARANAIMGELWIARMRRSERAAADLSLRARARGSCANALRLDPLDDLGHMCRARLATVQRDWSTAYVEFERAVELSGPRADRALVALASTALDENSVPYAIRKQRAFAHLERAVREYPYVAEVFAVAARIHHRLGAPEQAARLYRRASALRPERWDLVLWGLELQLDLGDASAASRAWTASTKRLREADPAVRNTVGRRLADALDLFDPHAFDDAAPSGASSDEP
jgi:tetratricopeptide (TPR) repeat protein